jgi:uncharacterized protein YbbC (DUF1343 family)
LYGDVEGKVPSGIEPISRLPLVSLYGETRSPTPAMLEGLDTLVFDLQDAGARFFTYISTMGLAMEAAAGAGLRFVVLDRPDPIRADRVAGPMLDPGRESFTAYMSLPMQHGMTIGELAHLFRDEIQRRFELSVDLQVVAMQGYRRAMWFDETGLDWVPPSPHLRKLSTAVLYPGVAWVEGANVSVGRGTEHPFEWVGAPWIDAARLVQALSACGLEGLDFTAVDFTPSSGPHRQQRCHGVHIHLLDRHRVNAPLLGLALVQSLFSAWPDVFRLDQTLALIGSTDLIQGIRQGLPQEQLAAAWQVGLDAFAKRRKAYLLY